MINIDEKPMECKVRETVLRILERAMHYNNTSTKQELTESKPTFFVWFNGHTAQLDVFIEAVGWSEKSGSERYCVFLTESKYRPTADEIQNQLVAILKRMEEVYSAWYEKEHKDE